MNNSHFLPVDSTHTLYVEEKGNPQGVPILFLHGGPGTGISASSAGYFDPLHYRIILFDQRGAGQSTPYACTQDNTTQHLVEDIEKIRTYFNISKWIVFGGSWGSTLALAYAQKYPENILGMLLRGIFLCDEEDLRWLLYEGAPRIWPKEYDDFLSMVPTEKRHDLIQAYAQLIFHKDPVISAKACQAWTLWEARNLTLMGDLSAFDDFFNEHRAKAVATIELHYFQHHAFLEKGQLLSKAHLLKGIPCKIIHGRYDTICPYSNAWKLHQAWPGSELITVSNGGHAGMDPAIHTALLEATEAFKALKS
jgi:proline iminopeptidase